MNHAARGRAARGALAAFLLAGWASGCTHAPWHPYRGWRAWKTANVTVYADTVTAPSLTQQWMEDSYQVLEATFFAGYDVPPVEVIEVQPGADSPFVNDSGGKRLEVAFAGLPVAGQPRALLMVGGKSQMWEQTHVLVHHFIAAALPGAPMWFHEGLAVYLMGFRQSDRQPDVICFGLRRPASVQGILEPLPTLFTSGWNDHNDRMGRHLAFTSYGLVDYLLHGRERTLRPEFRGLMTALRGHPTGDAALRATYPADVVDHLADDVPAHIRHVEEPNLCPLPYRMGLVRRARTEASVTPVPEATMKAFFEAMTALPARDGYADFFP